MKFLWVVLILGSSFEALAQKQRHRFHYSHIVKVISKMKDGSVTFQGSGLIAHKHGKIYVITSDHVVLQSDDQAQHHVYVRGSQTPSPCRIRMTSYRTGLTLLECQMKTEYVAYEYFQYEGGVLQGSSDRYSFYFKSFPPSDPYYFKDDPRQSVRMIGYPMDSFELISPEPGNSNLRWMKNSPLYMDVPVMLRVEGSPAEKGMSGGVLVEDYDDTRSVIVHGFLAYRWDSGGQPAVYVIPAAWGGDLLRLAADYPEMSFGSEISQSPRQQVRSPYDVRLRRYDFETYQTPGVDRFYLIRVRRVGKVTGQETYAQVGTDFQVRLDRFFRERRDCGVYIVGESDFRQNTRLQNLPAFYGNLTKGAGWSPVISLMCPGTPDVIRSIPKLRVELDKILQAAKSVERTDVLRLLADLREDFLSIEKESAAANFSYPFWMFKSRPHHLSVRAERDGLFEFRAVGLEQKVRAFIKEADAALLEMIL